MNQVSLRRINAEYSQLINISDEYKNMFMISSNGDNMYQWKATIYGPSESPYQNYIFNLDINIPPEYPSKAPNVKFTSPIIHINVNESGDVCLDILKNQWSATLRITTVLISVISLLNEPNPEDPFNNELASIYKNDIQEYNKIVRKYCEKHCSKN